MPFELLEKIVCPSCHSATSELLPHPIPAEGVATCPLCDVSYPIISKIPVLWANLESYLESRHSIGVQMAQLCRDESLRHMILQSMPPGPEHDKRGASERRWAAIYASGYRSGLYGYISRILRSLYPRTVLEHGCSVGLLMGHMSRDGADTIGIDVSFPALLAARRRNAGAAHILADSVLFECGLADMIISLNMLEVVEPLELLSRMASQSRRYMVLADPYDYIRGERTVRNPLHADALREQIVSMGFRLVAGTTQQAHIPWNIRINPRTSVRYMVDLVVAERL